MDSLHLRLLNVIESLLEIHFTATNRRLDGIEARLSVIQRENQIVTKELSDVQAAVQSETDAVTGAVTLLGQLSDLIRASKDDPAALEALATQISGNKQRLADAIVANTPAADVTPAPAPAPTPDQPPA